MSMQYNLDMSFTLDSNKEYWESEMNELGIFFNRKLEDRRIEYTSKDGREGYHVRLKNGRLLVESRFIDCSPVIKTESDHIGPKYAKRVVRI